MTDLPSPRAAYMPRKQAILLGIGEARLEIPEADAEAFNRLVRSWPALPGRTVEFSVAPFGAGNSIKVSAENAEAVANAVAGAIEARDLARDMTAGAANG
jgi:hypothetical protein